MCTPVRYLGALRYGDFQPLPARPGGEVELGQGTPWNSALHILMSKIIQKTNIKIFKTIYEWKWNLSNPTGTGTDILCRNRHSAKKYRKQSDRNDNTVKQITQVKDFTGFNAQSTLVLVSLYILDRCVPLSQLSVLVTAEGVHLPIL